jgi:homeobox-leucine zipper protein
MGDHRYNNIFATINSLGLNARQVADGGGCLCGVESSAYSSATEVQRGGADYMRRTNYSGSDGSLDNDDEEGSSQKLRFTKPQVRLLEHTFQTLQRPNCYQKEDLARELGVQPRQVDIWFQNRRARGKPKATDSDCDILRQRCQDLIAENHQLNLLIQVLLHTHSQTRYLFLILTFSLLVAKLVPMDSSSCHIILNTTSCMKPKLHCIMISS